MTFVFTSRQAMVTNHTHAKIKVKEQAVETWERKRTDMTDLTAFTANAVANDNVYSLHFTNVRSSAVEVHVWLWPRFALMNCLSVCPSSPLFLLPRIYGDLLYDCETFRTPSLMSKGTIRIRADVGWVAV